MEITAPSTLATTTDQLRSPASCVTLIGQMRWSRRVASLWRQPSRLREPAKALKVISLLARM
jgi:hypothetical protein